MLLVHDLDLRYLVVAGDVSIDVLWQHFENLFQKKVGARSSISLNAQRTGWRAFVVGIIG